MRCAIMIGAIYQTPRCRKKYANVIQEVTSRITETVTNATARDAHLMPAETAVRSENKGESVLSMLLSVFDLAAVFYCYRRN